MITSLKSDPQTASFLKIPFHHKGSSKQLTDISPEAIDKRYAHLEKYTKWLDQYNHKGIFGNKNVDRDLIQWYLEMELRGEEFKYYDYPVNPFSGYQITLPAYLILYQEIEDRKDIEAFHARLNAIPEYFGQLKERFARSRQAGTLMPVNLLDLTNQQIQDFISEEVEFNPLYLSFKSKIDSIDGLRKKEEYLEQTMDLIQSVVYPAYQDLYEFTNSFRLLAPEKPGVYNHPNGKPYYEYLVEKNTSLTLTPDSLYSLGISETWRIKKEMVSAMNRLGMETDMQNVIKDLESISKEEKYILGNSIQGRIRCSQLLDSLAIIAKNKTEDLFQTSTEIDVEVKRVPPFMEKYAPVAKYFPGPNDDDPVNVYFRMDILEEIPSFDLPTLVFHHTYPGIHFQTALHNENKSIPGYRKRFLNRTNQDGWAMYAEQIVFENEAFRDNPMWNIGRLHRNLLRIARMVADIGIHYKKWSYENAIIFIKRNTIYSRAIIESEVYNIASNPGQGLCYLAGYLEYNKLHEKAVSVCGEHFNMLEFNTMLISEGVVPFFILEDMTDQFIENTRANESE